jgi:hypothetical protein
MNILNGVLFNVVNFDFPESYQLGFQDSASPVFEAIINFHNYIFLYMAFIMAGVV